jgi:hypothetical protein
VHPVQKTILLQLKTARRSVCLGIYLLERLQTTAGKRNIRNYYPSGNDETNRFNQSVPDRLIGSHDFIFVDLRH